MLTLYATIKIAYFKIYTKELVSQSLLSGLIEV